MQRANLQKKRECDKKIDFWWMCVWYNIAKGLCKSGFGMSKTMVITSGKGGVGKTTITANLGRHLAARGHSVVLLDVDLGLNNLDVLTGIEHKIVYDIVDCIENRCRVRQALVQDTVQSGLYILPSCHSYDKSKCSGQNIRAILASLAMQFEYCLLDCPAGIELGFHRAVAAASEALVVVTPHISSIRDADKVLGLLKSYKLDKTQIIVNRARGDLIATGEMVEIADIKTLLETEIVGVIPDDDTINILSSLGHSQKRNQDGLQALDMLAKNIATGDNQIFDVTKKYSGVLGAIRRKLKSKV